jgi:signal transduction histidine kinase
LKLFAKYNRINVISTIIIFLLGSIAFSFLLRYVIISQIDEDLKIEKNEIINYVSRFNHLPAVIEVRDQYTNYKYVEKPQHVGHEIYTTKVYDTSRHKNELRRIIQFNLQVDTAWYFVNVSKSLAGTDKLIQTIIIITVSIILLIVVVTFFINRIVLRRLWQPFYNTLQTVQRFTLSDVQALNFGRTDIEEFKNLNTILADSLSKARHDYQSLKEFTENASHELQTPLAVIQSKLDILIQNEKVTEAESQVIQSAYNALQGLSKLNQSLLLLAKIENNQFSDKTEIDINELLQNKINQFSEIWKAGNIHVHQSVSSKTITGNFYLTEILLNNLLSNATKHNITGGSVNILLQADLQISNTGIEQPLDKDQLFKRFSKQKNAIVNHGLGLSIIQQICIASGYTVVYNFTPPDMHSFSIIFN